MMANRSKEEIQARLNILATRIASTDNNITAYIAQRDKLIDDEQALQVELEAILAEETTETEETPEEVNPPAE